MTMSASRFNMWRGVIAMMHVDGLIRAEERVFVENYFSKLPFTPEQVDILRQDTATAQPVGSFTDQITEPGDRADMLQFAHLLFWSDGDFDKQESTVYSILTDTLIAKIDRGKLKQLGQDAEAEAQKLDEEVDQIFEAMNPIVRGLAWLIARSDD